MTNIDPRVRLGGAAVLCVLVAVCQGLVAALAALLAGIIWLALALVGPQPSLRDFAVPQPALRKVSGLRLAAGGLWQRFAAVNVFVLLLWCTTPWATPGDAVCTLGPLTISGEGLRLALLVTLKANALACICMALLATLQIPDLTQALRFFRCPDKVVLLLIMALRNIHVLGQEWQRLRTAARLRGFAPRCSLHTYRTLATLLGLLLLRSLDRATRVREAMLLRGFQGQFPCAATRPLRATDALFMLVVLAQVLVISCLEKGIFRIWSMGA